MASLYWESLMNFNARNAIHFQLSIPVPPPALDEQRHKLGEVDRVELVCLGSVQYSESL